MTITINGTTGIAGVDGSAGTPAVQGTDTNTGIFFPAADTIAFGEGGAEVMRINSSGNVLVGTTTSVAVGVINSKSQIEFTDYDASQTIKRNQNDTGGPQTLFVKSRGASNGSNTVVQSGDTLGQIRFWGTDGSAPVEGATITASVDGTPGANDMPGRLVFSTTADGSSSPTERARITSSGDLLVGATAVPGNSNALTGVAIYGAGAVEIAKDGALLIVNRKTSDGTLVLFRQDGNDEGNISVSGTTVSYNGGHLSRWAQMLTKPDLLKGTVMSNLDEMNVYTDAEGNPVENEQLNKVKVSDVEGDVNVAGVFVNWEYDEAHQVDEINMAMTGDMIIRIAQGVVVQKGDLLMSAGDGTAKPQDDDIVRSKTVAKVTSNHVTCTYEDGSYCVPCVLMAC